ncbi:hypothetical protein B5S31_g4059 [[Candida] boidinii]|nr:hypothetical protein B5S31_g4059 [[Candida] boidinii]
MRLLNLLSAGAASLALLAQKAAAETHEFKWLAEWNQGNPDGTLERPIITCNGEFPWPNVHVKKGDRVIIHLTNGLGYQETSMHFHGLFQEDSNSMDGVPGLTQCNIAPNDTMIYNVTVPDQVGSYWYHSHTKGQYMDGMRGAFIIEEEEKEDYPFEFDEAVTLTVSEWYHDLVEDMIPEFLNVYNPTGAEPIPQNLLFNDTTNGTWVVEPNKTYLLRIINIGGFVSQYLYLEDHEMTVVEVDGVYVKPNTTNMIYITVAQRYTVLITTKNETDKNFCFMQKFDEDMLDVTPDDLLLNRTNWIVYNEDAEMPEEYYIDDLDDFLDDFYLEPVEEQDPLPDPDHVITIDVSMDNLNDGINYAFFNNITYLAPKVPTLGTVLSSGDYTTNELIYGENSAPHVLLEDEIVQIVLNNNDTGKHPFHLHGHVFQVIERGPDYGDEDEPVPYDPENAAVPRANPARRDVLYVRPQSFFVIRFKADNPGVWFFHCHIEWHLLQGLAITIIEDPINIKARQTVSDNWKSVCDNSGTSYIGNAANNSDDLLDLKGMNVQPDHLPTSFTARGIVALVFSCLSGLLGCIMIGFYGMSDIPDIEQRVMDELDLEETRFLNELDDFAPSEESDNDSERLLTHSQSDSNGSETKKAQL